jgi:hypothetical protein
MNFKIKGKYKKSSKEKKREENKTIKEYKYLRLTEANA